MARIRPLAREECSPASRRIHDEQVAAHGRMTNMKSTLAHSAPALKALMEWYALRDEVEPFLGPRATILFAHAISTETDCLICSTFFRRILIESGEDPDRFEMDERERLVAAYGRQLARDAHGVTDELFARLRGHFSEAEVVALTAFGALMVATNLFNNALRVDLDEYLWPYRAGAGEKSG